MKAIKIPTSFRRRPLLSLCVIFRDNVDTLPALLDSIDDHFDEVIFTDTGSTDGSRKLVEAWADDCDSGTCKVTDFEWCDDFAKARNANFAAASGKWRMFLDSDDVLIGGKALRPLIARADADRSVDGLFIHYDYDRLEELRTMRAVRWDSEWSWSDAIHERLIKPKNASLGFGELNPKEVSVRHRRKTPEDKERALRRNGVIAKREYPLATDPEYRARLARTIAMECKLDGTFAEAFPYLEEVLGVYPHLPEGRQAAADIARIHASFDDLDTAMVYAKYAGPSYEAIVAHSQKDYSLTIHKQTLGSVIPHQTTHEGFLFEKVIAPVLMADAGLVEGYPVSAVENVLNTVRSDLRRHDSIEDFTSSIRGFIDRITILVPGTPQPFDSSSTDRMLGGSEEAVVYLARSLARLGRNVRVYGVLPPLRLPGVDQYGIEWQPFDHFDLFAENGTLVVWRALGLLHSMLARRADIQQRIKDGDDAAFEPSGIGRASLWLHDMSVGVHDPRAANQVMGGVNSVIVLSKHHQKCIERELPQDHKVKFVPLSNGIVGEDFRRLRSEWSKRDPNRVIYSSCPSRGLRVLLEAWPKIKAACPKAYLDIYYDWNGLKQFQPELHSDILRRYQAVQHLDVEHHGGVGHEELHLALSTANVWAYSHFENTDVETFCVSAIKAMAAGCEVITAPNGALPEVVPEATFVEDPSDYAAAVIKAVTSPRENSYREVLSDKVIERFDWDRVAQKFSAEWTTHPHE